MSALLEDIADPVLLHITPGLERALHEPDQGAPSPEEADPTSPGSFLSVFTGVIEVSVWPDPFAIMWEREEGARWRPVSAVATRQLEHAIVHETPTVELISGKETAIAFIAKRMTTVLSTGRNQPVRRRRPQVVYDSVPTIKDSLSGVGASGAAPTEEESSESDGVYSAKNTSPACTMTFMVARDGTVVHASHGARIHFDGELVHASPLLGRGFAAIFPVGYQAVLQESLKKAYDFGPQQVNVVLPMENAAAISVPLVLRRSVDGVVEVVGVPTGPEHRFVWEEEQGGTWVRLSTLHGDASVEIEYSIANGQSQTVLFTMRGPAAVDIKERKVRYQNSGETRNVRRRQPRVVSVTIPSAKDKAYGLVPQTPRSRSGSVRSTISSRQVLGSRYNSPSPSPRSARV